MPAADLVRRRPRAHACRGRHPRRRDDRDDRRAMQRVLDMLGRRPARLAEEGQEDQPPR